MDVSGCRFLMVPVHTGRPRQGVVCVCMCEVFACVEVGVEVDDRRRDMSCVELESQLQQLLSRLDVSSVVRTRTFL